MPRIKLRPHKVYMTDEEYERVRAKAAHAGCEFSSYARIVLGGKAVPSEVLKNSLSNGRKKHGNFYHSRSRTGRQILRR